MVRVFQTLAQERQLRRAMGSFTIVSARTYTPTVTEDDYVKDSDVPWLGRFAKDGGRVVISGDMNMMDSPHEQLALQRAGFIVIFFERKWSEWDFFRKSSLLLHYWRHIAKTVKRSSPGTIYRVPGHWREDGELQDVTPGKKEISKDAPSRSGGKVPSSSDGGGVQRGRRRIRKETRTDSPPAAEPDDPQGRLKFPGKG